MFKYLYDLFMSFVAFLMGLCGANKIEPESEVKEKESEKESEEQLVR